MPDAGPGAIDVAALREQILTSTPFLRSVDVVAETGSTNADLIARAARGEDIAGAVLIAENQTAGRGRNGRVWSSVPRAQVIVSVGVPATDLPVASWGWVPLVTGLAVVDAVAAATGVRAGLKWPNDVLAGPSARKLAGILAEVAPTSSVIVVGVGLNVSYQADELPDPNATSLALLGAPDVDRGRLVGTLLRELQRRIERLSSAGADSTLVADYTAHSLTIGARVRATLPGDVEVVGEALSVDDQGRLRINAGAGGVTVVSAGDIIHLRPLGSDEAG